MEVNNFLRRSVDKYVNYQYLNKNIFFCYNIFFFVIRYIILKEENMKELSKINDYVFRSLKVKKNDTG